MGGSNKIRWTGGGGDPSGGEGGSAEDLEKNADKVIQRSSYESNLNDYYQQLLQNYNDRDIEGIRRHLDDIANALEDIEVIKLLYGGSVARYTYINGFSDVDTLAILNNEEYSTNTPSEILDILKDRLKQRYPNSKIRTGNLAVTIKFSDGHEIQILPAIRTATGYRIANQENNQWSNVIRPDRFAKKLTDVNQNNNRRVIPTIKLYKSINSQLPKEERLSGYHIESLAIEAFENYNGSYSTKEMLFHFTKYIKENINRNIEDSSGQSIKVDEYLGSIRSPEREKRRIAASKIYRQMEETEKDRNIEKWKGIMENYK